MTATGLPYGYEQEQYLFFLIVKDYSDETIIKNLKKFETAPKNSELVSIWGKNNLPEITVHIDDAYMTVLNIAGCRGLI